MSASKKETKGTKAKPGRKPLAPEGEALVTVSLRLTQAQIDAIEEMRLVRQKQISSPISRIEMVRQLIITGAKASGRVDFPSHL